MAKNFRTDIEKIIEEATANIISGSSYTYQSASFLIADSGSVTQFHSPVLIPVASASAMPVPQHGTGSLYAKYTDDKLYFRNSHGTEYDLTAGGGGGGGSPAGSNTQVQFNDGGSFGASANLTFDGTDLGVSAKIFHVGDTDTYINFTDDDINIQAGGVNFLDFTQDTQSDVTFNEGGVDIDFRVETADESHMLFIEGSSNRMSIGDNTGSPGATLEVKNHASAGATGVPLVQLNSNDTDEIALDINAANIDANVVDILANAVTTAKVLNIGADGLTTGNALYVDDNSGNGGTRNTVSLIQNNAAAIAATALHVQSDGGVTGIKLDKNYSDTTEASITGLHIDWDKTGASTSDNTMYGIYLDMDNITATNGNNYMYGLYVTPRLTHAADAGGSFLYGALINAQGGTNGSSFVQGARIEAGGGDVNYGLQLDVEDGGVDLRIESSADNGDYFQIQTTTHGATTLSTVDDNATAANLTLDVDGKIIIEAAAGDETVFNEGGVDVDFRVESDDNTHMLFVDAGDDTVAAGGNDSTNHKDGFAVFNDFQGTTFESKLADGQFGSGEVLKYSPGADDTLTAGQIYFLHTDGTWDSTDADAVATGASQMLGVGLGGSARTVGVLIRGFIRIPSTEILNVPGSGAVDGLPVYVSATAGHFDFTAPSASDDFVRIVGYAIDDDSGDVLIYFNPDSTFVEIA